MIITIKKLRGRPRKDSVFRLSYVQWLSLKQIGMTIVGGYLLKAQKK